MFTAPFNNMRTLTFKAHAFFATVNQMFGGSSQLPTSAERAVIKSLSTVQTKKQCSAEIGSWKEPLNIWSGLRFRPVGLRFRPQGLRFWVFLFGVFVFGSSFLGLCFWVFVFGSSFWVFVFGPSFMGLRFWIFVFGSLFLGLCFRVFVFGSSFLGLRFWIFAFDTSKR